MKFNIRSAMKKAISVSFGALIAVSCVGGATAETAKIPSATAEVRLDLGNADCPTAYETVDAIASAESLNTVKGSIFGANVSWIDDGNGLWDSKNQTPYQPLVNKLKNSGVYHIRYPGGIEGDYLHWYDTVGAVSDRVAQINPFSSEYPTYDTYNGVEYRVTFGVEELFKVCRAANVKATIQLNAGNGTPEEAANYVKYLSEKNHLNNIDSICVGNEVCMSAENVDGMTVTKNPDEYVRFCRSVFSLLGDRFVNGNDLRLGVIGITPSHPLCAYRNWDAKILDALSPKIDFLDVHIGYSYYSQGNASAKDSVACFMASSKWISSLIEEEKGLIQKYAGDYADGIDLQITELGPVGGDYPNSLAGAVFTADLYNTVLSEPKITATDYLPLLNHYASAQLIGAMTYSGISEDEYYWDNCVSYVYKMYSDMVGSDVLKTTLSDCQTFDAPAVGLIPKIEDVPVGSVAVYYNEESDTGSIYLINKSQTENRSFSVTLPTKNAKITGVTELWNADPTVGNSYREPTNVMPKKYDCPNGRFGTLSITSKPISLLKIDFSADDIAVIPPKKTTKTQKGESESTEQNFTSSDGKNGVVTPTKQTSVDVKPNTSDGLSASVQKIIRRSGSLAGFLLKIIVALAIVLLAEILAATAYWFIRRKRRLARHE